MKALEDSATPPAEDAREPLRVSRSDQVAQALILAALLAIPAFLCMRLALVGDADVWWHLRTGQWILQHRAIPRVDSFTSFGAGRPWQPYSWLYELLVFKCFQHLGLAGIVAYSTGLVVAITAAIVHLVRRLQHDFSLAALLVFVAGFGLARLYTPRPWLFTILFFTVQLDILMHARRTGKTRELLWLPVIYALWANVHIQFIDGLVILALALVESVAAHEWPSVRTRLGSAWMAGIFAACVLATLLNPFGWHIYQIAYDMATHSGVKYVIEMRAPEFRAFADYCMLFLALAAVAALAARSVQAGQRRFPLLETVLLAFAAIVSFRSGRDMWVMVIVAIAILAQEIGSRESNRRSLPAFAWPIAAAVLGLLLYLSVRVTRLDNAHLRARLATTMPVRAVEVVKENNYPGPLYNNFGWGGYLIWDLRMPVSVDGRTAFSGDNRLDRSFATWGGAPDWASDPDLQSAKLVIGPVNAPLTQLLRMDPQFQLAFEDNIAAVFVARSAQTKPAIPAGEQP